VSQQIESAELERAWTVCQDHQNVLADVISRMQVDVARATAFQQDFITHLAIALRRFDAKVGRIEPWLYTVFLRFVQRQVSDESRRHTRLREFTSLHEPESPTPVDLESRMRRVDAALPHLKPEHRACISEWLSTGSLRSLARAQAWSRYQAEREMFDALVALATRFDDQELLSPTEIAVWRGRSEAGLSWEEVANATGHTVAEVRAIDKAMWRRIQDVLLSRSA
jgi:hypothetical protein